MTTPTDPTTLRTALEALVSTAWMSDEDGSCVLCGYGFDPEDHTLTDCPVNLARAALATPAPAADEARCGFMWSVDGRACGRPEDDERHTEDAFLFHPFHPAPTPAPPTPPATEPVAALVSELVGDLRLSELGRDGRLDIVARKLDAIVVAARAEVDVEALAEALDGLPYRDCEMWVNNDIPTIGFARDIAAAYLAARAEGLDECDPCCAWCHSRRLAAAAEADTLRQRVAELEGTLRALHGIASSHGARTGHDLSCTAADCYVLASLAIRAALTPTTDR